MSRPTTAVEKHRLETGRDLAVLRVTKSEYDALQAAAAPYLEHKATDTILSYSHGVRLEVY